MSVRSNLNTENIHKQTEAKHRKTWITETPLRWAGRRAFPEKHRALLVPAMETRLSEWRAESSQQIDYLPSLLSHCTQEPGTHVLHSVVRLSAKQPEQSHRSKPLHPLILIINNIIIRSPHLTSGLKEHGRFSEQATWRYGVMVQKC